MIVGEVNAKWEPVIPLDVRGSSGRWKRISAIVDTGYTGTLTLPLELIEQLELKWDRIGAGKLADGRQIGFDVYEATVQWNGRSRSTWIAGCGGDALVGMELLHGLELRVQIQLGGSVTIAELE